MQGTAFSLRLGSAPVLAASLLLAGTAQAQIDWAHFHQADSRLIGGDKVGINDSQERDFAWADLDKDGWTDLVVVRRKPFINSKMKRNVLFMNEGGFLVDRTKAYAKASDVIGDKGFMTRTNDRDVEIVDVDQDGWLDVVTATTISPGQPKHVSHPRIYMNLGLDGNGDWLGLRFESGRTPDFGTFPNFCGLGTGDVTGDGYPDIYFAHYDQAADVDLDDRLLINDGTGHFTDESAQRMTPAMLSSGFGTSAEIRDMNGDGVNDVVKNTGIGLNTGQARVDVSYNDPANEGYFDLIQTANATAPYHVNVGDLNNDGRPDIVESDDFTDKYHLNQGNDALGRVIWSSGYLFDAPDDSFSNRNTIVDLDGDGWNDVFIMDMDIIFAGCNRRLHIYHNLGGVVGGVVDLHEESDGTQFGVSGMTMEDQKGTWDVAVFDLDLDGDNDMIIARCSGYDVWINQAVPQDIGTSYCGPAVANSTGFPAVIGATGSEFVSDEDLTLAASDLPPNQPGYFVTSLTQGFVPNPGGSQGNLCLAGSIGRFSAQVQTSGDDGAFSIEVDVNLMPGLGGPITPGETWSFQAWYRDLNPTATSNFTDGVSVDFQ